MLQTYDNIFRIVRRQAWQSTAHALLETSVVHILLVIMSSNTTVTATLRLPILLLITGLMRDRAFQLANKLFFFLTLLISSLLDKKQQRGSATTLTLFLSLIFFPVILAIMAAAAALSAPLLPLFTLPIFFVAFPRPQRFWPEPVGSSANVCPDTVYYRQLAPMLARSLQKGFACGSLGKSENTFSQYVCGMFDWKRLFGNGTNEVHVNNVYGYVIDVIDVFYCFCR